MTDPLKPQAPPGVPLPTPFEVHMMNQGAKGESLGASYDNVTAVTIACTVWQSMQDYNPTTDRIFGVFDNTTGNQIAAVGPFRRPV